MAGPLFLRIYPPTTKKATGTPRSIDRLARFMWEKGAFGELHATTTQETSEAKGILVSCMSVDPESWVWFPAWACVESETMGHGRLRSLAGRETNPPCTPLVCMGYSSRQYWPCVNQSHCDAGGAVESRNSWAQTSNGHFQSPGDCVQDQLSRGNDSMLILDLVA